VPTIKSPLDHGRASFDRRAWGEAFEAFVRAEGETRLERDDLERLAWSAALRGKDEVFLGALERLHKACEVDDPRRAARAAFWLGFYLSLLGSASAPGWFARASRLIEHEADPCVERGYLLIPSVLRQLATGDDEAAGRVAAEVTAIGERCRDRDLVALARNLEGRALARQGLVEAGLALLDEVMVSVTSDELSPLVTGVVYCNVIASCQQVYALDRAREWTAALARWCDAQPELVTFTGICMVHRAELMQLGGAWQEAIAEVGQLVERYTNADPDAYGDACYQRGELHRLRGEHAEAEKVYRLALEHGREPQPGLSLLRLSQGQTEAAASAMRRALATTAIKWERARLLPAFVEIMLAAGALDEARQGCVELEGLARDFGSELLGAMAAHARGALTYAEGDVRAAIAPLRHAFGVWQKAGAPYLAARIHVLLGRAYLGLGDREGGELALGAARKVFEALGAKPDLDALDAPPPSSPAHGLSSRELEVLRLLSQGKANKAIAKELFVSERTVDRHVSNIFTKIGVASRTAAAAYAYEHGLV
jgi:DNA-binding CsgD family transcriptional regulator